MALQNLSLNFLGGTYEAARNGIIKKSENDRLLNSGFDTGIDDVNGNRILDQIYA